MSNVQTITTNPTVHAVADFVAIEWSEVAHTTCENGYEVTGIVNEYKITGYCEVTTVTTEDDFFGPLVETELTFTPRWKNGGDDFIALNSEATTMTESGKVTKMEEVLISCVDSYTCTVDAAQACINCDTFVELESVMIACIDSGSMTLSAAQAVINSFKYY